MAPPPPPEPPDAPDALKSTEPARPPPTAESVVVATNEELVPLDASVEFPFFDPAPPAPTVIEIVEVVATVVESMNPPY